MFKKKNIKYISFDEALSKLQKYCVYQDRCHKEVRSKLLDLGIYGDDLEKIIVELIQDNFLNEVRFAQSYARGKFRIKRWGKMRIKREMKMKGLSDYCIKKGLAEIDEEDYEKTLDELLTKKRNLIREKNEYLKNKKLASFVYQKGYEQHMIWDRIKILFPIKS